MRKISRAGLRVLPAGAGEAYLALEMLDYAAIISSRINKSVADASGRVSSALIRTVVRHIGQAVCSEVSVSPAAIASRSPRDAAASIVEAVALAAVYGSVVDRVRLRGVQYHCSFDNSQFESYEKWCDLCTDFDIRHAGFSGPGGWYVHYGLNDSITTQHDPRTGIMSGCSSSGARPGLLGKVGATFTSPATRDRFFREFMSRAEFVKDFDGERRCYI